MGACKPSAPRCKNLPTFSLSVLIATTKSAAMMVSLQTIAKAERAEE